MSQAAADFDADVVPGISATPLGHLAAGGYVDTGEPVVLLGDSETGESHPLIGLGLAACERGRCVRYITCAQLVNELVARYRRLDLLLLDKLGYIQINPCGAEMLFQITTERKERASIGIAANLSFSE